MLFRTALPYFGSQIRPSWPGSAVKILRSLEPSRKQRQHAHGLQSWNDFSSKLSIGNTCLSRSSRRWACQPLPPWSHHFTTSRCSSQAHGIEVELSSGKRCTYDFIFLRDACSCSQCVNPSTSQRYFDTAEIPLDLQPRRIERASDGSLNIEWRNDSPGYHKHSSRFSAEFLETNASPDRRREAAGNKRIWKPWLSESLSERTRDFGYAGYMKSDDILQEVLQQLAVTGIAFLSDVPQVPAAVDSIATRIGPLRNSFYGETWDVRSVGTAKNIAYTAEKLGFHMDLLYMADPPRLQLLHCLEASASGGESLFSDSYAALRALVRAYPSCINSLAKFRTTFRYKNAGQWYQQDRPTLELSSRGIEDLESMMQQHDLDNQPTLDDVETVGASSLWQFLSEHLQAVNWSPPFQGPFQDGIGTCLASPTSDRLRRHVKAISHFKSYLEDSSHVFETRMRRGTCVIFDNRRIVHARRAFEGQSSGRWLRGAYVDGDAFRSRLKVLNMNLSRRKEEPRIASEKRSREANQIS